MPDTEKMKQDPFFGSLKTEQEEEPSLRVRYEEKKRQELKVERKPVAVAIRLLNGVKLIAGGALAFIGAFSLVHPGLRGALIAVFQRFFFETGLIP